MYFDKLTTAVVGIVMLAASTGQLPKLIYAVRKAQIQLIQETKASKWGQVPLLPESSTRIGRGHIK